MEEKKVLLSIKDLEVKFRVRGRQLTAIRGTSLDIYENESIAIVGESGSGKSVFTKTFAGMLDENGYIANGSIIFNDPELADTSVTLKAADEISLQNIAKTLDRYSKLENGAASYNAMRALEDDRKKRMTLSEEDSKKFADELAELNYQKTEAYNTKMTFDPAHEKDKIKEKNDEINALTAKIKALEKKKVDTIKAHEATVKGDSAYQSEYSKRMAKLQAQYNKEIQQDITPETSARNLVIAKEIYLSVGRYGYIKSRSLISRMEKAFKEAMTTGRDLMDEGVRNEVFDNVVFRVRYLDEKKVDKDGRDIVVGDNAAEDKNALTCLHGTCVLNMAKIKFSKDWTQIRGSKIATIFQDPMTSLNPILTIGKQITSIILKHQNCSEVEARARALELMRKVGIPNAEKRFDDYPFQYSGGMRQRIVIAIALSCQPKILICDEPTTALDVTIQAQILKLLKDLQKEFHYTIVFITHDLGVVANIADRVAVMYAGQIIELASVKEIFYDPRHPYTWALLSSMPQLAQKNTKLYSITGTPPSLYNKIIGDPFAPRNPYCMKIDTLEEPPMFKVTDTHYAKTWLLDPRSPKVEKPEIIENIHEKLIKAFNI